MASNVHDQFTETHIHIVWSLLHNQFGFDIPKWKKKFSEFHSAERHPSSVTSSFYRFGNMHINKVLNEILQRQPSHNTFNRMIEYILKRS